MIRFLDDNDVVSFPLNSIGGHHVFKVSDLKHALRECLRGKDPQKYLETLLSVSGPTCEVMSIDNPGWRKGRIRMILQFEIAEQK
jgi:hypothetical protein